MFDVITIPYEPREWQAKIHANLKRFNVLVIHRGAGKSILATQELLKGAITGPDNAIYLYILPQLNQARRNVWEPLKRFLENLEKQGLVSFNNSSLEATFWNGAKIILLGADNPESLRGLHVHGVVLDEFADMHPETWTAVRPMTTNHKAWVIWIGTPKGENRFFEFYEKAKDPTRANWYHSLQTWQDTGALDESEIEEVRRDFTPEAFAQEMECSFNAALVGAYYANALGQLDRDKKILRDPKDNPYREDLPVHTAWDLGIADSMTVWWFQLIGDKINVLRYEEGSNMGFPEWKERLDAVQKAYQDKNKAFRYGLHWAPHDIKQRELSSGATRLEQAARLGIQFRQTPNVGLMDGIILTRENIKKVTFYEPECKDGLKSLRHYSAKTNNSGMDTGPKHDWASHGADAFRYLMVATQNPGRNMVRTGSF